MTTVAACRMCGIAPVENARFCHSCGSPVENADTHAEFKQVTVLFVGAVDSMEIAAAVGAQRLHQIITELVDRSAEIVGRYGGTVDKFTGDGIVAIFGAPVVLEDHAICASMAALEVQREAGRLAAEVERRDGIRLRLSLRTRGR